MIRLLFIFLVGLSCYGQVLPVNRSVDWTVAGLTDTSTAGFTYYNAVQEGAIPDGITPANALIDSLLQVIQPQGIHRFDAQHSRRPHAYRDIADRCRQSVTL